MSRNFWTLGMLIAAAAFTLVACALLLWQPMGAQPQVSGILFGIALGLAIAALLRWLMPAGCDAAPAKLRKRYTREVMLAMGGYVVLLVLSILLLKRLEDGLLHALIALLPVPPMMLVLRAMIRYIRDADELQQRIELEAVSFATAFVSLIYLTGGFLQSAKVIDVPSNVAMIWVFPFVCLSYGLAKAVVARRYH
ncbi:hypothetical protein [Stenotrophomonas sp.]|uniref:hypothetical protein n=1 Tax=Stenotrophomonas sp. TaxID=69392 RepID=UPI0028AFF7D7|nr:hypothetical protein [Stenotrophomonas sp.]